MKTWGNRFFASNKKCEVELKGVSFSRVFRSLDALNWTLDDEFWAPDFQGYRFLRETDEIFVIQETYFDPKLTGSPQHIETLSQFLSEIDPNVALNSGAGREDSTPEAEQ